MKDPEEKKRYSEWLALKLEEHGINQTELAKAIGVTPKSVSRYINSEAKPSDEILKKTIRYFDELENSHYSHDEYSHMESDEFIRLFRSLWSEFKSEITQKEFAERAKISQSELKRFLYTDAPFKISKEKQFRLLMTFWNMSAILSEPDFCIFYKKHYGTGCQLDSMLDGKYSFTNLEKFERRMPDFGEEYYQYESELARFLEYPSEIQNIVLSHTNSFCDNSNMNRWFYNFNPNFYDFKTNMKIIRLFRKLPVTEKNSILRLMEERAYVPYKPYLSEENMEYYEYSAFYEHITDYQAVILLSSRFKEITDDKAVTEKENKQAEHNSRAFQSAFTETIMYGNQVMNEIDFKLSMKDDEWYIWYMLVIWRYKGYDLNKVIDLISTKIYNNFPDFK